jgi:putative glycosyltransferase (TIGR04372 family)
MTEVMTVQQLTDCLNQAAEKSDAEAMLGAAQQLVQRDPNNGDYLLLVLHAMELLGRATKSLALIQNFVLAKSTNVVGFSLLHRAYIERGQIFQALISLAYALSIEPENSHCQALMKELLSEIDPKYTHVRLNIMTVHRIGHLCVEVEPWARAVREQEQDCLYLFISNPRIAPANAFLYELLGNVALIVESEFFYNLYVTRPLLLTDRAFAEHPYDLNSYLRGASNGEILEKGLKNLTRIYNNYPPCLALPEKSKQIARDYLLQFGICGDDRVVCLHVRDSAYMQQEQHHDFSYHDYRDADITTYHDCVENLIKKGYKVVRIGAVTNQELDFCSPHYLDLCVNRDRDCGDLVEVFLLSECAFFLCTSSGPFSMAALFDTPIIAVNVAPVSPVHPNHCHYIPKLLYQGDKLISVTDIYNGRKLGDEDTSPIKLCLSGTELADYGYRYENNSSEDIRRAVAEFEKRVNGDCFDDRLTGRQKSFLDAVTGEFYAGDSKNIICDSFIRDHPEAFPGA